GDQRVELLKQFAQRRKDLGTHAEGVEIILGRQRKGGDQARLLKLVEQLHNLAAFDERTKDGRCFGSVVRDGDGAVGKIGQLGFFEFGAQLTQHVERGGDRKSVV